MPHPTPSCKLLVVGLLALPASLLASPKLPDAPYGVTSLGPLPAPDECQSGLVERKKTIVKVYDVDKKDNLLVDNQFGQVRVNVWDKKEIRVQITITAEASTESRVQEFLDAVEIVEKKNGDQIALKTELSKSSTNWTFNGRGKSENNYVRIDYDVQMPRQNALSVRNRFGNTDIAQFSAPLSIHQRYGNFSAEELTGSRNDIDVAYGRAVIRQLESGKVDVAYGALDLDRVNVLTLVNKFGKMKIGEVNKLDADIGYSGAHIGTLKESARIRLEFSGGFRVDQLAKTADNVDIQANYSSVALPCAESTDCDFNVKVSYGDFRYPNAGGIQFTAQPSDADRSRMTKQYSGKIGRGTGPKIRVVSSFGSVNFK